MGSEAKDEKNLIQNMTILSGVLESLFPSFPIRITVGCIVPQCLTKSIDASQSLAYFASSKPAGPLSSDMLSLGGCFFVRRGWA